MADLAAWLHAQIEEDARLALSLGITSGRVLREIKAKRAILSRHQPAGGDDGPLECNGCGWCWNFEYYLPNTWPCDEIKTLAAIYGWNEEKP